MRRALLVVALLAATVMVVGGSCAPRPADPAPARAVPARGPLNGRFEIRVDESLDPLSVTARSVRVTDAAGHALDARVRPLPRGLEVTLVVDSALWQQPPAALVVNLAGGAAGHPLLRQDGRPRARSEQVRVELDPRLAEGPAGGLRLADLPPDEQPLRLAGGGLLELAFEGVLDPASVGPAAVPLFPEAHGTRLAPLEPAVDWQVVGSRSRVSLRPGPWSGTLWLVTRRLGLRALDGSAPEPRLEREVVAG